MSDEEQATSSTETATHMLTAEYKDGMIIIYYLLSIHL